MTLFSSLWSARLDRELGTDDSTVLFTSARRQAAVNEGQTEFADLTDCYQRRSTVTVNGGIAEFDLMATGTLATPPDFVKLSKEQIQFRYVDASSNLTVLAGADFVRRDVTWLNTYEPGWQHSTVSTATGPQLPSMYYIRPDAGRVWFGMWPTPSTGSSASADVVIPYFARPPAMASTTATAEPFMDQSGFVRTDLRVYHQALVHYAAHLLEKLRRDYEASDQQLQKFLGYVARYWQANRIPGGTHVTPARSYFSRGRGQDRGADPRT